MQNTYLQCHFYRLGIMEQINVHDLFVNSSLPIMSLLRYHPPSLPTATWEAGKEWDWETQGRMSWYK